MRREPLTPSERVLRARLAAYMLHARRDSRETTQAARRAFDQRFLDQVDPERRLPDRERRRRAEAARRAYFTRLAFLSARKRRSRRLVAARRALDPAEGDADAPNRLELRR
jgi:hypothetical protein